MCGILAIISALGISPGDLRKKAVALAARLRHRGPDWGGIYQDDHTVLAHERLAIVDIESGAQPLLNEDETVALTVNGEIYNHNDLREILKTKHTFRTKSDCEPILHLWEEYGDEFLNMLSGDFAFVLYDSKSKAFLAARDPIGVCPLYIGWGRDGSVWFASEMKALVEDCTTYQTFPPGHYYTSKGNKFVRWYNPPWWSEELVPTGDLEPSLQAIRARLEEAVVKRMMGDVPYGVLLSGGLDSSLVASIACRHVGERGRLRSFAIGLRGAPDLAFARQVADFLGTVHHEFYFTVQEGLDALRQIIWHLETYDVTTIRASTPMYLLARKIKALGVKMVLSGEGSDEVFGGYLYFHRAPSQEDFHRETVRRVKNLHVSDCLRANKSTAAWGLEVRVPFLDKDFLDAAFAVHPRYKVCGPERMEKWLLRTAFDTPDRPYLPQSILWRQKEQFSDGVGYSWISSLKEYAEREIPDDLFARRAELYPEDMPATKEAFMYRQIFEELFPSKTARETVVPWVPTWSDNKDPSGRAQAVHIAALVQSAPCK